MDKLKAALSFLNLLDAEGRLSITNLAVVITLVKLAISPAASLTEAGMLLCTLTNYAHKRVVTAQAQEVPEDTVTPQVDEMQKKIEDMTSQVSALAIQSGMKKMN